MNKRSRSQRNESDFSENNSDTRKKRHNLRSLNGKTPISKDEFEPSEEENSDFSDNEDETYSKKQKISEMDDFQPVPPKSVSLSDESDAEAVTALMILGFKEPNAAEEMEKKRKQIVKNLSSKKDIYEEPIKTKVLSNLFNLECTWDENFLEHGVLSQPPMKLEFLDNVFMKSYKGDDTKTIPKPLSIVELLSKSSSKISSKPSSLQTTFLPPNPSMQKVQLKNTPKRVPQESSEKFQLKKREIKKRSILHVQIAHFINNLRKGKSMNQNLNSGTSPKTDNLTLKPFTKPSTNYYPYQNNNSLYKQNSMSYQPTPQRIQTFQAPMYSNSSRQMYSTVSPLPPAPIQTRNYPIHNPYAPPVYSPYSRSYDLMQSSSNPPPVPNQYRHQGYYDNPNVFNQRRSYPQAPLNQNLPPRPMNMNHLKYPPFKQQK